MGRGFRALIQNYQYRPALSEQDYVSPIVRLYLGLKGRSLIGSVWLQSKSGRDSMGG